MSAKLERAVATARPVEPPHQLTPFDEIAAQVIAGITEAVSVIPAFEPRHPENERFIARYQTFSSEMIRSSIAAAEATPEFNIAGKLDVEQARAALQYEDAFRPVIDKVEQLLINLKFTSAMRKSRIVAGALQTYQIAKGIGRDPGSAAVAAHAQIVKRDLRRPGGPKKVKPAPVTPAPHTSQTPTT